MSVDSDETPLTGMFQGFKWYAPITAWLLGAITVIFLSLLGGAINASTELVNISGELITSVRLASIGLGTGFYIGSSLRHKEAEKSWFLLGVFTVLSVLTYFTIDTVIFGQYPAFLLLVAGGVLTVIAHATPLVVENDEYIRLLKYIAGYLSTSIVVLLAASEFIVSFVVFCWNWFGNQSIPEQSLVILLCLIILGFVHLLIQEQKEGSNSKEGQSTDSSS